MTLPVLSHYLPNYGDCNIEHGTLNNVRIAETGPGWYKCNSENLLSNNAINDVGFKPIANIVSHRNYNQFNGRQD